MALALVLDPQESQRCDGRGVSFQLAEAARLGAMDFFTTGDARSSVANESELTQALTRRAEVGQSPRRISGAFGHGKSVDMASNATADRAVWDIGEVFGNRRAFVRDQQECYSESRHEEFCFHIVLVFLVFFWFVDACLKFRQVSFSRHFALVLSSLSPSSRLDWA